MNAQYIIKSKHSVTTVTLVVDRKHFVSPKPLTIISTQERTGGMAGGPRNSASVMAEHIAAISAIGAHEEATKLKNGESQEPITLGFKSVVSGHYPEQK